MWVLIKRQSEFINLWDFKQVDCYTTRLSIKIVKNFQFRYHHYKKKFILSNKWIFKKSREIDKSLEKLINSTLYKEKIPFKSKNYLLKRYFNHPYFVYNFHEVYEDKLFIGLVISREAKHLEGEL